MLVKNIYKNVHFVYRLVVVQCTRVRSRLRLLKIKLNVPVFYAFLQ